MNALTEIELEELKNVIHPIPAELAKKAAEEIEWLRKENKLIISAAEKLIRGGNRIRTASSLLRVDTRIDNEISSP